MISPTFKGLFQDASDGLKEEIQKIAQKQILSAGENLFDQGDASDHMYMVEFGQLQVSVLTEDGRRRALDILATGDSVGEIGLLDGGLRTATVHAKTDCVLRSVSRADLESIFARAPALAMELLQLLARRMRLMSEQLHAANFLNLEQRLASKVLQLAAMEPDGIIRMSHADIAEFVGGSREAVSRILSDWRNSDTIELQRRHIKIRQPDDLATIIGSEYF